MLAPETISENCYGSKAQDFDDKLLNKEREGCFNLLLVSQLLNLVFFQVGYEGVFTMQ